MFHECKLVHADLSEYNILYHNGGLTIIDVSQSVEHDHPSAFDFLRSDISNVEDFFAKRGVQTLGVRKTFEFVTREKLSEDAEEKDEDVLKKWLEERAAKGNEEAEGVKGSEGTKESAEEEERKKEQEAHEDSVFTKSFIPRTLNEVYDPERDVEKVTKGEGSKLIYADTIGVVAPQVGEQEVPLKDTAKEGEEELEEESDEDADGSEDEGDDQEKDRDGYVERKPRGHKFEDKDAKKVCYGTLWPRIRLNVVAGEKEGRKGGGRAQYAQVIS